MITSVEPQRKDSSRVSVYVDGVYAFGVHRDVAVELGIRKEVSLTPEDVERARRADTVHRARRTALDLISYRQRTESELRRSLSEKGFDEDIVASVISGLSEDGYIDDTEFAAEFVEQRIRSRRYGAVRIRSDLLRRGILRATAAEAISRAEEEADWKAMALREARKSWQRMPQTLEPLRRRKRLHDHLVRRGFDYDLIREVVSLVAQEGDSLER